MKEALKFRELVGHRKKFCQAFCSCKKKGGQGTRQNANTAHAWGCKPAAKRINSAVHPGCTPCVVAAESMAFKAHLWEKNWQNSWLCRTRSLFRYTFTPPYSLLNQTRVLFLALLVVDRFFLQTPNHNNDAKFIEWRGEIQHSEFSRMKIILATMREKLATNSLNFDSLTLANKLFDLWGKKRWRNLRVIVHKSRRK